MDRFSRLAQNKASRILNRAGAASVRGRPEKVCDLALTPENVLKSLIPLQRADDLVGSSLVLEAWFRATELHQGATGDAMTGVTLEGVTQYARANDADPIVRTVLDWIHDSVAPGGANLVDWDPADVKQASLDWIERKLTGCGPAPRTEGILDLLASSEG